MTTFMGDGGDNTAVDFGIGTSLISGFAGGTVSLLEDSVGDTFHGGLGNDTVSAGRGNDEINGDGGNDSLDGMGGVDTVRGGGGNDLLRVRSTSLIGGTSLPVIGEIYDGGGDVDTLQIWNSLAAAVTFDFRSTSLISIERLEFVDAGGALTIQFSADQFGTGLAGSLLLIGGISPTPRVEILEVFMGNATSLSLAGLTFANWGSEDRIIITGDDDAESIVGASVYGTIYGGGGNDTISRGGASYDVYGGEGDDTFMASDDSGGTIGGGNGTDTLEIVGGDLRFGAAFSSFERIVFTGTGLLQPNFISSSLPNNLAVVGRPGSSDRPSILFTSATPFSAAGWTFTNWEPGNVVSSDELTFYESINHPSPNSIIGSSQSDRFFGGVGADSMYGGGGDDYFTYTAGADLVSGEIVDGGSGIDTLVFQAAMGYVDSYYNIDGISVASIERLEFSNIDAASGDRVIVPIVASQVGAGLSTTLAVIGESAVAARGDIITVALANLGTSVNLSGWTFSNWNSEDQIVVSGGNDGNTIVGTNVADQIAASGGNDTIAGQGGNDIITGGLGLDVMSGDDGDDTFVFTSFEDLAVAGEIIYGGTGTDTIRLATLTPGVVNISVAFGAAHINSIERLEIGTNGASNEARFASSQVGAGLSTNLAVVGGSVANSSYLEFDVASGASFDMSQFTFSGGMNYNRVDAAGGAEVLYGSVISDYLFGYAGADTLWGSYGADGAVDNLWGGDGSDTYFVYETSDVVGETNAGAATSGIDLVYSFSNFTLSANVEHLTLFGNNAGLNSAIGNAGDNALNAMQYTGGSGINFTANDGNDTVYGSYYNDVISGGNGNDTLWGSWGADGNIDAMTGGNGRDTYYVQEALNSVTETNTSTASTEIDTVYSAINMTLGANLEYLFIYGSATQATGNSLGNAIIGSYSGLQLTLSGLGGSDSITGGAGNDTIDGGTGIDVLFGSGGADTFVFAAGQSNGDVMNDFNGAGAGALEFTALRRLRHRGNLHADQLDALAGELRQ